MNERKRPKLEEILIEDDASRFLEALPADQRWPKYDTNRLPSEGKPLTEEERKSARRTWMPNGTDT